MADSEKTLKLKLEYVTDKPAAKSVKDDLADIQAAFDDATKRAAKLKAELDDLNNRGPRIKATLSTLTKSLDTELARSAKSAEDFEKQLSKVDQLGRGLEQIGRDFGASWVESLGSAIGAGANLAETLKNINELSKQSGGSGGKQGLGGGLNIGNAAQAIVVTEVASQVANVVNNKWRESAKSFFTTTEGTLGIDAKNQGGLYNAFRNYNTQYGPGVGSTLSFYSDLATNSEKVTKYNDLLEAQADAAEDTSKKLDTVNKSLNKTGEAAKVLPPNIQKIVDQIGSMGAAAATMAANSATGTALGGGVSLPTGGMVIGSPSVARRNAAIKAQMAEAEAVKEGEDEKLQEIKAAQQEALKAEQDYQLKRLQSIQSFNLETQQLEKRHRVDMRRMEQDSQRRMTQFARQRDAISFIEEFESGRVAKKRAQQDFKLSQNERKAQFQLELDQAKQENAIKQAGYAEALKGAKNFASEISATFNSLAGGGGRGSNINYAPSYTINNRGSGQLAASTISSMVDRRILGALGGRMAGTVR